MINVFVYRVYLLVYNCKQHNVISEIPAKNDTFTPKLTSIDHPFENVYLGLIL